MSSIALTRPVRDATASSDLSMIASAIIDAAVLGRARSTTKHLPALVEYALKCRNVEVVEEDVQHFVKEPGSDPEIHSAIVNHAKAEQIGFPVHYLPANDLAWEMIWHLYTEYAAWNPFHALQVLGSRKVSLIRNMSFGAVDPDSD